MFSFWKRFSDSFKHSFLVIIAYGLAFGLGYLTRIYNPSFIIHFYLSEQARIVTYQLSLKDLIDIIIIGPVFTIFSFILLRRIIKGLTEQDYAENKILIAYTLYLIAIVLFNYGNIIHVTMNRLNSQIIENYSSEQVYYAVYFLDEFIGHHLITIGFFIIFCENCFLHTLYLSKISQSETLKISFTKTEQRINYLFGIGLGIATAMAYLEGQCAFLFLILNPIFGLLMISFSRKKELEIKKNSLVMLFLIMTVVFTVIVVIWAFIYGIKPFYPYFYQRSEII